MMLALAPLLSGSTLFLVGLTVLLIGPLGQPLSARWRYFGVGSTSLGLVLITLG